MHDIIVIGGGPAGLTAALYALRGGKSVLVIEKDTFGGQMTFSPKIENYPGFAGISGNELAELFAEQVMNHGADVAPEKATGISVEGNVKTVRTLEGGEYTAKSVIIATGAKHRLLGVPNETKYIGNGISFCAVCDGAFYAGQDVAVIGGGNSALQEASMLAETCKSVTVIQNLPYFTGEEKTAKKLLSRDNVTAVFGTVVAEFTGDDELTGLIAVDEDGKRTEMRFDGVFVAIGLAPDNEAFKSLAETDKYGYVISDEKCLTKTEGVFVAGDCRTKNVRQITTATADGAAAALAAAAYIDSLQ